jgi:cytoskeletal protein RodZ
LCAASSGQEQNGESTELNRLPGLPDAPSSLVIGLGQPPAQQAKSSPNVALIWSLVVVAVVLAAGGLLVGLHFGHSAPQPGATSATVVTSHAAPTTGNGSETTNNSGNSGSAGSSETTDSTTTTTIPAGLTAVDTSAVAGQPSAGAVALTFETYFGGIDNQNWDLAYSAYSPQYQSNNSESSFESTLTTTSDTEPAITSIQPGPLGSIDVGVSFQSSQAAADGPVSGETCTNWTLTYTLVPGDSGSLSYLINSAAPIGPGHTGCPGQP